MTEQQPMTSLGGCFVRVVWMLLGPSVMAVIGLALIANRIPIGHPLDFVLFGTAAIVIVARFLDVPRVDAAGGKRGGRPVPYTVGILLFGVVVFAVAHFVVPALFPAGS